jgi:hypothetical protein
MKKNYSMNFNQFLFPKKNELVYLLLVVLVRIMIELQKEGKKIRNINKNMFWPYITKQNDILQEYEKKHIHT